MPVAITGATGPVGANRISVLKGMGEGSRVFSRADSHPSTRSQTRELKLQIGDAASQPLADP